MNWKFNPRLAFLCLQRGLALESDFGKYAYQQLADRSSQVYVRWLAVYQSGFDSQVASPQNNVSVAEFAATDYEDSSKTKRRWARRCKLEPCGRAPQLLDCFDGSYFQVTDCKKTWRWTRKLSSLYVHAASGLINDSCSSDVMVLSLHPSAQVFDRAMALRSNSTVAIGFPNRQRLPRPKIYREYRRVASVHEWRVEVPK